MDAVLLPGMDGTGTLFRDLRLHLSALPLNLNTVTFSPAEAFSYERAAHQIQLPSGPFVVIAESFSGPLAIRIAQLRPAQVRAVVLAATFVRNPAGVVTRFGALLAPLLFRIPPPAFALRRMLLDAQASDELVTEVARAVRSVRPRALASRLREIAAVDVSDAFKSLIMPVLFIAATRDRLVKPRTVRALLELRPGLRIEWLDRPHLVLQTRAEAAARAIARFLLPSIDESARSRD